jgi:ABC-2 type transport system ATP-binding protein
MKYSLGMRKKLSLARTLLHEPSLILLDEPTANLDPGSVREVLDLLNELRADGKAILISTHQVNEVERIANRVALLRAGRLLAYDRIENLKLCLRGPKLKIKLAGPVSASSLQNLEQLPGVRALDTDGLARATTSSQLALWLEVTADVSRLLTSLGELGLPIVQINQSEPTLEEVFLEAVA